MQTKEVVKKESMRSVSLSLGIVFFYIFISIFSIILIRRSGFLFKGDDLHFHIDRVENLVGVLKGHNLLSFISTYAYNRTGIAVDQFYPNLFMYPFAILRILIKSPVSAIYDGFILINLLTCFIAHLSYKSFSGSNFQAFIFTNFYFFATWRFTDMFARFDLGELLAIAFIPLAFLGFYEVMFRNTKKWPILALGMSLILYSHLLSALMIAFCFVLMVIVNLKKIPNIKLTILRFLNAMILFLVLSFGFIYSFLYTSRSATVKLPVARILQNEALNPFYVLKDSISNSISIYRPEVYNIGIVAIAILILLLRVKPMNKLTSQLTGWTVLSLWACTNLFPWFIFQNTPVKAMQFPWRCFFLASFFISVLGVQVILFIFKPEKRKWVAAGLPLILLMLNMSSIYSFVQQREQLPTLNYTLNAATSNYKNHFFKIDDKNYSRLANYNYGSDYIPETKEASNEWNSKLFTNVAQHRAILPDGQLMTMRKIKSIPNGMIYKLPVQRKSSDVSLPFYVYNKNNYVVKRNGSEVPFKVDKNKLLNVRASSSKNEFKIQYVPTHMQLFSIFVSIMGFFLILGLWVYYSVRRS
ncbi:hypothetical protein AH70_06800 [Pediococcus damnosus LMG 28219]|uniref:hypothetical protein n=1 Tax=Pediococcus damnosus TaxID=51663 RepID=UPI00061F5089|nr:hypothetical protein [Pediococcus damnosus]KJU75182.1 hypothetical protein AH70_06800 [Pediococcus damnosus LMG 28219]